jgi:hypothetical protein
MTAGSPLDTRAVTGTNFGSGRHLPPPPEVAPAAAVEVPVKVPELLPAERLEPGAHLLVIICVSIPVLGSRRR